MCTVYSDTTYKAIRNQPLFLHEPGGRRSLERVPLGIPYQTENSRSTSSGPDFFTSPFRFDGLLIDVGMVAVVLWSAAAPAM